MDNNQKVIALLEKAINQIIADYDVYHIPVGYIRKAQKLLKICPTCKNTRRYIGYTYAGKPQYVECPDCK